ncbi:hypothetical protein GALL_146050 [mine drainage metagenome]|uniref:Uncharacterized protein n=1 Tax=mine drainage metagenome TaxID=410659 RepID=A0A1J5SGP6_9ZZZZ
MVKTTHLIAAILSVSVSVAYAETSGRPTQPASRGAASVGKNLDANKSGSKADKGLATVKKDITAKHKNSKEVETEKAIIEKAAHAEISERPAR